VVYRCRRDLRPDMVIEILKHGTIEILGIIDGDLLRNSVATDDVLPEEFLDGGGGFGCRLRFNLFSEVFHCDDGESVISFCWSKFTHDINAPPLHGLGWGYQL
jgi:hypothetical protein